MTNNDILRRLRFAFNLPDTQAVKLFSRDPNSSCPISVDEFQQLLAKPDDAKFKTCSDQQLTAFLDGLIVLKRGLKEPSANKEPSAGKTANPKPAPTNTDPRLSKNLVLRKLRIALNFQEQQMLDTLKLGGSNLSKSELNAFFRNPQHKHYRTIGNQVLRNFIKGLTLSLRAK